MWCLVDIVTLKWTTFQRCILPLIIALMMEEVGTSETFVHFNVITCRYILDDSKLHTRRRENLKSHIMEICPCMYDTNMATIRTHEMKAILSTTKCGFLRFNLLGL
jgi:hypothetical protein